MAHRLSFVHARSLATLVAGCLATVLVVGCNDPELERQAAFERQFKQVAAEYAEVMGGRPDLLSVSPSEESIAALRAVADKAKGLSGGSAGQQKAARELAASVMRTSASIQLARATWLESSEEVVRGLARSASGLAADLEAIASAAEAMDLAESRSTNEGSKSESSSQARALKDALQELEGPAGTLNDEISEANSRLAELGQEAAVLLRKARESSASAGLAFVEEAAAIKTEARNLAKTTSMNQIEADAMAGEGKVVGGKLQEAEAKRDAATSALDLINSFESSIDGEAAKARDVAKSLRSTASNLMKSIADERAGALKAAYEAAAADMAAAAGDTESDALKNSILSDELRMRVTQVMGMGAQGRMLASAGGDKAAGLSDLKSAAEAAITELKDKATAAAEQFASAGEDPALASLKGYVDGVKKMADGLTVDLLMNPPKAAETKVASGSKSSGRSMSGAGGASEADLDALIARMNAAEGDAAANLGMVEYIDDSTPAGKAMKDMLAGAANMMKPLMDAVSEKFGAAEAAKIAEGLGGGMGRGGRGGMGGMGAMSARMRSLTKKSVNGDTAICTTADGEEVTFTSRSGSWKLDVASTMSEEQAAQMQQLAPMLSMMMAPMKAAAEAVAARVKAGEFTSAEEAGAALQQEMMKGLGGGMGGGFGGAGRGRGGRGGGDAGAEGEN